MQYLIYSQKESDASGEPSFWANENGWSNRDGATVFDSEDIAPETLTMPMPDGVVLLVDAVDSSGFIHVCGRRQAIEEGALVDITSKYPEEAKLFKYPVAFTEALWAKIERATNPANGSHNDITGIIWDILFMALHKIKRTDGTASEYLFDVIITGLGEKAEQQLKIVVGPDDNLAPCITVMLPLED